MNNENSSGMRRIQRALISVSDKSGLIEFARELRKFDVEIISTGGTATTLRNAGIEVRDVSQITGFPEMMDGRVKTLHPRVHGALLALRDKPDHVKAMVDHGIKPIDMVVVNLYPFEQTIARAGVTFDEAVEQIDIGGPSMIRSAAKNHKDVTVVVSPETYGALLEELDANNGSVSLTTRQQLATAAYATTSEYDLAIAEYLGNEFGQSQVSVLETDEDAFPAFVDLSLEKIADLRYGENPHQKAALYRTESGGGLADAKLLGGKEMSFNNYVDTDAAIQLVYEFEEPACAIIKHTNPAGTATGETILEAYRKALQTDPLSAFGGIVAFNRTVDLAASKAVTEIFTEAVIAPGYEADAIEHLRTKKNLRIVELGETLEPSGLQYSTITGGMLVQTADDVELLMDSLKVVTSRQPNESELRALRFAWKVCKHTKSNAIVYARDGQTVGVGAGQMSRVDSVKIGAMRAQLKLEGSVLASDAFFPFRDGVDEAAKYGITAIIQPGGSVRDSEVIEAANEHNLAMVFTGVRHFRH